MEIEIVGPLAAPPHGLDQLSPERWDEPSQIAAVGGLANTWRTGAANAWSTMVVDSERRLVFLPTGSASPDYYGGLRPGDNKWANSVVALRVKKRVRSRPEPSPRPRCTDTSLGRTGSGCVDLPFTAHSSM
jgi:hypothetical protein